MIAAQRTAGTVAQAGYMKVYDPAFELAQRAVREMDGIRFVQMNHLHPDNRLHLRQFDLRRFDDYPAAAIEQTSAARSVAVRQALGDATPGGAARLRPAVRQHDPRPVHHARHAGAAAGRAERRDLARRPRSVSAARPQYTFRMERSVVLEKLSLSAHSM